VRLDPKLWRHFGGSQLIVDAGVMAVLGGAMALVLLHPGVLTPTEGALLMAGVGFLLILGRRAIAWPRAVPTQAFLPEWAERVLAGERRPTPPPHDLAPEQMLVAQALSLAMSEILSLRQELGFLKSTLAEDWAETDEELSRLELARENGILAQSKMIEEIEVLGQELRSRLDAPELAHRVTARTRGLGIDTDVDRALFQDEVEQFRHGMERLGELTDHIRDSVPRLRKEAEQLTALGFGAGRRSSRLWAAIQAMSGQAERLVNSSRSRRNGLAVLRGLGDRLHEEGDGLKRRLAQLRMKGESRALPLGRIEESLRAIDQVAHQTGLLAVNAAILAQEQRGSRGFQVIGSKIRLLAEQTALGAAEVSRGVAEHRQGLDTEERRLEELQEAVDQVLTALNEFQALHTQLDHQGMELERALESHQELVRSIEGAGKSAVEALKEIQARSEGVESAVTRQRAVEQETNRERQDLLSRVERIEEHAMRLMRSEESALADLWMVLDRHAQVRGSAPFRSFHSGRFDAMSLELDHLQRRERENWKRLEWSRSAHRRVMPPRNDAQMEGITDAHGRGRLLLLRRDALGLARPSALEQLRCDVHGGVWTLQLRENLRSQESSLAMLVALREALTDHWVDQPEMLLTPEGVQIDLGGPFPDFPDLLAGLAVTVPIPEDAVNVQWRDVTPAPRMEQRFLWLHPSIDREGRSALFARLHEQVAYLPAHESLLTKIPKKDRPPCIRCAQTELEAAPDRVPSGIKGIRPWGVDADPSKGRVWIEAMGLPSASEASSPVVLGAVALPYPRPEALLLALLHPSAGLGFELDPALMRVKAIFVSEVLEGQASDPTERSWSLLDELVQGAWLVPLPD
jgi:methyl-accepting chemotaxis protein